jgi:hypothetical protein
MPLKETVQRDFKSFLTYMDRPRLDCETLLVENFLTGPTTLDQNRQRLGGYRKNVSESGTNRSTFLHFYETRSQL